MLVKNQYLDNSASIWKTTMQIKATDNNWPGNNGYQYKGTAISLPFITVVHIQEQELWSESIANFLYTVAVKTNLIPVPLHQTNSTGASAEMQKRLSAPKAKCFINLKSQYYRIELQWH
jgi:hypothetical protein